MKRTTMKEIEEWKAPEIESSVIHSGDFATDFVAICDMAQQEFSGFPTTCWPVFNKAFGGARPGEVVVLTGDTGSGKTTFAMAWMLDTVRDKRAAFFISLEMPRRAIVRKLAGMVCGKPAHMMATEEKAFVMETFQTMPLYYFDAKDMLEDAKIFKAIQYAAFEKKCRFVVLDHLEYVRKRSERGQDESSVIRDFMCRLTKIAQNTQATVVLIAHPSKLNVKGAKEREIGMDELKGSSSIKQEADAVLAIFAPQDEQNEMIVRFHKIRSDDYSGNRKTFIRFFWDDKRFRHEEISNYPERGEP